MVRVRGNLGVWGKTDMDVKLKAVAPGTMIRITFTGMQETKNNPMYKYKIEVDKANCIDVGGVSDGSADSEATGDDAGYESADDGEEQSLDAEAPPADEPPPARAQPPKQPAKAPDAARQAQVQALLNRSRAAKT